MTDTQKQPFYKKKWFIIIAVIVVIGSIFSPDDEDKKDTPKPVEVEENTKPVEKNEENAKTNDSPYEELAKYAFGEDVKCEVIEGWGDDNKPKITRINITDSGEPMVQPFLINVFSYLKKTKEKGLDYESVFFILRSKKTDGKEYPYAKIEIEKEAADNFDFNSKDPVDLKAIATIYDAPDAKEISSKESPTTTPKTTVSNDDTKKFLTAYIKEYFKDDYDISIEEENDTVMINMYPKEPELKKSIMTLMLDPTNPQLLNGWEQMSQNFLTVSKNLKEQIDENVSILILNPLNPEAALLVTFNDFIFSDFTKDN